MGMKTNAATKWIVQKWSDRMGWFDYTLPSNEETAKSEIESLRVKEPGDYRIISFKASMFQGEQNEVESNGIYRQPMAPQAH